MMKSSLSFMFLLIFQSLCISQVHDLASVLTAQQRIEINGIIKKHEKATNVQIGIHITDTLNGKEIFDYSFQEFERWKLGQKYINNGILITIAPKHRWINIMVGQGMEYQVTDYVSKQINISLIPALKEGQYFAAIKHAVNQIISLTEGYPWTVNFNSLEEIIQYGKESISRIATFEASGISDSTNLYILRMCDSANRYVELKRLSSQFLVMKIKAMNGNTFDLEYSKYTCDEILKLIGSEFGVKIWVRVKETHPLTFQLLDVE